MRDQATRLRELLAEARQEAGRPEGQTRRAHVIAIASGKGGVGKSNISLGLSLALREEGRSVILFDADLGTANLDVLLGMRPTHTLAQVIAGRATMADVIQEGPRGLKLLPGGSGIGADLSATELRRLVTALRPLESEADFLVIDTGAGIGQDVTAFALAADTVVVVTTPEPTAMTDAYALMKTLIRENPAQQLRLLVNRAESIQEASATTERLAATALQFLGTAVDPLPPVPEDRALVRAVKSQVPLLMASPDSPAASAIRRVARALIGRETEARPGVGLFLDRLSRFLGRRT
ncbi:MAG TPA: MinD/ParA family protein [Symbiobacteriaceae bacterium]|nr:MinD/ParA family protein [Symbiobacteriaceae bacterium]